MKTPKITYRIYKQYGTKCIRKFETWREVHAWCCVREHVYRVEYTIPAIPNGCPERHIREWVNC